MWYTAHLIMAVKYKKGRQVRFPVWDNIVLIQARSESEAFRKAELRGAQDAGDDDGTFHWGGKPAKWVFAGVRKVTLCQDESNRPDDGTEISFVEMELRSESELRQLVQGEDVEVRLTDRFAESIEAAPAQPRTKSRKTG